jgi:hypothetical protein
MTRPIAILAAGGLLISPLGLTSAFADAFTEQNAALDVIYHENSRRTLLSHRTTRHAYPVDADTHYV